MKKRILSLLLVTALIAAIALPGVSPVAAAEGEAGRTYTVKQDGSGDFTTIQAAANVAQPGDTVLVYGGTYREEVVLPRGGTGEDARITLKAVEGEEVIVTGSDPVAPSEWQATEMPGVYKLVKPNSYFPGHREDRGDRLPGWTSDLDQFNPFNSFWRSRANSSTPSSGSGANQKLGYVSCGQVYLNGEPMNQRWSLNGEEDGITNATFGTVAGTPGTWIAYVDVLDDGENPLTTSPNGNPDMEGDTAIYVNFGDVDPRDAEVDTEINVRMQCLTAEWNLGYITMDGFTVMRGAGPKTVDFWQIRAEGMFGAISTNGGYHWIIENCDVTQCRGVGIDFGNGSRGQEDRYGKGYNYGDYSDNTPGGYNGNGPELYGYHKIRDCNIFDNATNGVFAYRGAYTEIYGCTFVNNNAINTGLASEAYFKNVSGGFGINLHDNYFYSDQTWNTMPIWMDCENDDAIVANNVVYAAGKGSGSNDGFSNITYELNAGWNLFANNIIINCGISNGVNGNFNVMNNLLINTGNFNVIGSASQARAGAEGGSNNAATISDELTTVNPTSARNRTNRVVAPGTLTEISTVGNPTSRFDGYSRYNKFMGNILFGSTSPNTSGTNYDEASRVTGYGEFVLKRQDECEPGHVAMPDFSGGVASFHAGLPDVVALQQAGTVFDWTWVYAAGEAGKRPIARTTYGSEADWNVHYGMEARPAGWESRGFEQHGVVVPASEDNSYVINGDRESFSITLTLDDSAITVNPPLFTSAFMGPSDIKQYLGYTSYPPSVSKDILGNARNEENNTAGPFADLKAGENVYQLWPRSEIHEPAVYTVKQDGSGDYTTIQAAADVAQPGDTILVYGGTYREQVIFPRGGTGEDARITLRAAEGEDVTVTGSEIVTGWTAVPELSGVWSITIPGTIFEEDVGGAFFNPYAVRWQSRVRGQYPTCGTIYLNDAPLEEVYQDDNSGSGNSAQKGLLVNANTWKLVAIDETTNDTTVWANFGDVDPNAAGNITESNARKQVITGKWNQGYITVDGFTVLRGCAPKAIDFWRSDRASMSGGIATNGGYYWIIENCDVSQCRGVAVDFGLGSRTHEVNSGGTPDVYGYHIIRNNNIHDNQSNGVMAYCGPYTEIYGNILANNNAMNTTLLSEAYVKDVNGGWGIKIYDNYFYSDKTWGTLAIWLDSETDGCVISNNIIYSETGGFNSTYGAILYETCHGWNVCSNNIVVGGYIRLFGNSVSDTYVINNLIIDTPTANQLIHMGRNGTNPGASFDPTASPVPTMGTKEEQNAAAEAAIALGAREIIGLGVEGIGFLGTSGISTSGSEGATYFANGIGVGRSMRPIVPGELTALGTAPIPEYRDYNVSVARLGCTNRYNKLLNNIFFDAKVTGSGAEVDKADYISDWVELTRNYEAIYENGSRSSVFYPATARAIELTSTLYRQYYQSTAWGNRADYNAYYKGASSDFSAYATGDGYVQDGNSVQKPDTGNYNIEATQDSFKITLTVDESVLELGKQSYLTADGFGPASAYKYLGVDWYPDDAYITRDFFGNERDAENNVIGPFADLKAGYNVYQLWPQKGKLPATLTGSFDVNVDILEWGSAATKLVLDLDQPVNADDIGLDTFSVSAVHRNPVGGAVLYEGPRNITKVSVDGQRVTLELESGYLVSGSGAGASSGGRNFLADLQYSVALNGAVGDFSEGSFAFDQVLCPVFDRFPLVQNPVEGYTDQHYRVHTPAGAEGPLPLVLFSHGSGGTYYGSGGVNNEGAPLFSNMGAEGWFQNAPEDAILVLPQRGTGEGAPGYSRPGVIAYINYLIDQGIVDGDRVYVSGNSMGGGETLGLMHEYPNVWAAALPICPAGSLSAEQARIAADAGYPVWFVSSIDDPTVRIANVRAIVAALVDAGAPDVYFTQLPFVTGTELPNAENPDFKYNGHWSWIPVLNNFTDPAEDSRGPIMDWLFAQTRQDKPQFSVTSPVSKIVAGCAANIPADVTFAGEAVPFDLGLYNPSGALIDTLRVSADGRYTFKITASDTTEVGAYVIKAVGAASGCAIDCVAQPDDLWAPTVAGGEGSVTVVFASDVSFNAAKKSVKIDGVAVSNSKVSVSGKVLTIADTTAAAGQTLVIAGVKYADLFPSYSFTFTLAIQ